MFKDFILFIITSLFIFFTASCSKNVNISPSDFSNNKNILIVPYKSLPIMLRNQGSIATAILFPLAPLVTSSITYKEREEKSTQLQNAAGTWNPSIASAQGCMNVLSNSNSFNKKNILISDMREFPGAGESRAKQPGIFMADGKFAMYYVFNDWWDLNKPAANYLKEFPNDNINWILEVTDNGVMDSDGSSTIFLFIKLFDKNSGKMLAQRSENSQGRITPITKESDFPTFQKEYTAIVEKLCGQTLSGMGIL